ncbi:hypothetical protein [Sigmofec virus UA08Rod_6727]|uniref:Uncharacterized protein n=1 Tax=Sigmofec virus UA08Rod_6727 TaxID=2929238 RepID=A0A976R557_9VIRU|nr:hypothetical protein [Sigmofec virus UA08Rod_6727]
MRSDLNLEGIMQDFINEYMPYVMTALSVLISGLIAFFGRRFSIKNLEDISMKYRTSNYTDGKNYKPVTQSFSPLVPQYRFNEQSGELEQLPDMLDVQKLIDSHLETSLSAMFDKFMPKPNVDNDSLYIDELHDELDELGEFMSQADDFREKYGLPDDATPDKIYAHVSELLKQAEVKQKEPKPAAKPQFDPELIKAIRAELDKESEVPGNE